MSVELLYTSAPKGLRQGSRGFCTVVSTVGMPINLAQKLESLSGYRHLFPPDSPKANSNPIAFSHLKFPLAGQTTSVISRVAAYGTDYSGRTNKLAHHLVVEPHEMAAAGPAWLMQQPNLMRDRWDGQCQTPSAGPVIPGGEQTGGECRKWQEVTGDAGWGGVIAQAFTKTRGKPAWIIYSPAQQNVLLELLNESIALLPMSHRWNATFSTYATHLPPDIDCRVRCVVKGTEEAQFAPARGQVVELCEKAYSGSGFELLGLARGEKSVTRPETFPSDSPLELAPPPRETQLRMKPALKTSLDRGVKPLPMSESLLPPPVPNANPISHLPDKFSELLLGSRKRGKKWVPVCIAVCLAFLIGSTLAAIQVLSKEGTTKLADENTVQDQEPKLDSQVTNAETPPAEMGVEKTRVSSPQREANSPESESTDSQDNLENTTAESESTPAEESVSHESDVADTTPASDGGEDPSSDVPKVPTPGTQELLPDETNTGDQNPSNQVTPVTKSKRLNKGPLNAPKEDKESNAEDQEKKAKERLVSKSAIVDLESMLKGVPVMLLEFNGLDVDGANNWRAEWHPSGEKDAPNPFNGTENKNADWLKKHLNPVEYGNLDLNETFRAENHTFDYLISSDSLIIGVSEKTVDAKILKEAKTLTEEYKDVGKGIQLSINEQRSPLFKDMNRSFKKKGKPRLERIIELKTLIDPQRQRRRQQEIKAQDFRDDAKNMQERSKKQELQDKAADHQKQANEIRESIKHVDEPLQKLENHIQKVLSGKYSIDARTELYLFKGNKPTPRYIIQFAYDFKVIDKSNLIEGAK